MRTHKDLFDALSIIFSLQYIVDLAWYMVHGQTSLHQLYIKKLSIKKVPTYVSCEYWQRKHMANEQQMNFMHRHISLTEWKIDQNCRAN